jgi:hypothetical protein
VDNNRSPCHAWFTRVSLVNVVGVFWMLISCGLDRLGKLCTRERIYESARNTVGRCIPCLSFSKFLEIDVITTIKHTHKCAVMGFYHRKEVSRVRCSSDQVWKELSDSLVTLC